MAFCTERRLFCKLKVVGSSLTRCIFFITQVLYNMILQMYIYNRVIVFFFNLLSMFFFIFVDFNFFFLYFRSNARKEMTFFIANLCRKQKKNFIL